MPHPKTVCLDFDGVIHSYTSGWKGVAAINDPPMPGAIQWIGAHCQKFDLAIYSSRSKHPLGRRAMKRWLRAALASYFATAEIPPDVPIESYDAWELADGIMRVISWPWFKPPAWLTIDDRAIQFKGTFPTAQEVEDFKPWKINTRAASSVQTTTGSARLASPQATEL